MTEAPPPEMFMLLRDGKRYDLSDDEEVLRTIIVTNPDFTARNPDGSAPRATIVRYVMQSVINH